MKQLQDLIISGDRLSTRERMIQSFSPVPATTSSRRYRNNRLIMDTPTAVSPEEKFSRRLGNVLKGITSPIATGGMIQLSGAPTITHKPSGKEYVIEPAQCQDNMIWGDERKIQRLESQVTNLQDFVDKIPQAAFGQGTDTVYDPSVRDALQLKAEDFDLILPPAEIDRILSRIKRDLHYKQMLSPSSIV